MVKNRIRDLREDMDLRQIDLATKLGIPQRTISGYETGNTEPPFEILFKMSDFFNVSIDYLIGKTNNPSNDSLTNGLTEEEIKELKKYKDMLIAYRKKWLCDTDKSILDDEKWKCYI